MELVTGATGYVGGRLLHRLVAEGRPVRALARRPELVHDVDVVRADLLTGSGLDEALDGCSTAYYLIHSMEAAANGDFAGRDRRMAESFAEAAARAGVERIVYLGGIVPGQADPAAGPSTLSPHLRSRLEVEEILLSAVPGSTALRASIVIGAGSSSFRILVRLVERLRV
ncbi:MAG TPA: NAD(P)H-binding protein, partial [Thermoleophilaceae bacterium]|nr:NAD(P)H-binding protein [Thermoleophilaceae bacterium]